MENLWHICLFLSKAGWSQSTIPNSINQKWVHDGEWKLNDVIEHQFNSNHLSSILKKGFELLSNFGDNVE